MTLYLANWATDSDWDCFEDDGNSFYDGIADLATPTGILVRSFDDARKAFLKDANECLTHDEQLEDNGYLYDELIWVGGEEGNLVYEAYHGKDVVAVIVMREIALPEERR